MTEDSVRSFEKFNYLLRPSKQVERKLLIETFHRLAQTGHRISEYTYIGLGSVYFIDFILFHRYLYIDQMICVEREQIPRRMRFNSPYKFIKIKMKPVSEVIPTLRRTRRYLVWLDYDCSLFPETLEDIDGFVQALAPGSILVITVDARPRLPEVEDTPQLSEAERVKEVVEFYREHFQRYAGNSIEGRDIGQKRAPTLLARIIRAKIAESMRGRSECEFHQLFNFEYADNAPMLTIGGVIDRERDNDDLWNECLRGVEFLTAGEKPVPISVPPLTERERQWIDSNVGDGTASKGLPFELKPVMVKAYRKFARHYPSYHEAVV